MSNQSSVISKNSPELNSTGGSGGGSRKKVYPIWVYVVGAIIFFAGIFILVSIMKGGNTAAPTAKVKQDVPTTESAANGARPNKNNNTNISQQENMGAMPVTQDFQNNSGQNGSVAELRMYKDEATQVEMVQTPSGPVPTASIEGQKFIEDYSRLKQESSGGQVSANSPQAQIDNSNLSALTEVTNSQIQALDEKINTMYETNDHLQEVIKKQVETIEKMAMQIQTIQPLTKSPKELAEEIFGKNGQKVLESRNRAIKVDTVVGDKAFFTDENNNVSILKVGDVVPNTSLKIIKIDQSTNSAIAAY